MLLGIYVHTEILLITYYYLISRLWQDVRETFFNLFYNKLYNLISGKLIKFIAQREGFSILHIKLGRALQGGTRATFSPIQVSPRKSIRRPYNMDA